MCCFNEATLAASLALLVFFSCRACGASTVEGWLASVYAPTLEPSLQPQGAGHSAASLHCWMPCAGVPILMPDQQLNPCMVCVTADCRPITSSIFHEEEDLVKDKMQARAAQVRFVWQPNGAIFAELTLAYFFVLAPAQHA